MPRTSSASLTAQVQQQQLTDAIDQYELPKSLVSKIAKSALPNHVKLQKDAVLALVKSSTVFVNYLGQKHYSIVSVHWLILSSCNVRPILCLLCTLHDLNHPVPMMSQPPNNTSLSLQMIFSTHSTWSSLAISLPFSTNNIKVCIHTHAHIYFSFISTLFQPGYPKRAGVQIATWFVFLYPPRTISLLHSLMSHSETKPKSLFQLPWRWMMTPPCFRKDTRFYMSGPFSKQYV